MTGSLESPLVITEATTPAETRAAADFMYPNAGGGPSIMTALFRALRFRDNFLALATENGEIVGACLAFRFFEGTTPVLHSHFCVVDSDRQGEGIGYRLKLFQGDWARRHGIEEIRWTYNPVLTANGHFNLNKIGAVGVEYLIDFYGSVWDEVVSDRVMMSWRPGAEPAKRTETSDAEVIVAVGDSSAPRSAGDSSFTAPTLLIEMPPQGLDALDPAAALVWHEALRWGFAGAMSRGYRLVAFERGHYVLQR